MLLLTTTASSVLVLGYVLLSSITGIAQTAAQWGYDNANIAAVVVNKSTFPKEEFNQWIQEDARIKIAGWQGNITGVVSSGSSGDDKRHSTSVTLSVLEGSYQDLGFETLEGNNPQQENEIAIGVGVAKSLNKKPGDFLELYIEGEKRTFLITGIYQAIANMSISGRITMEAMNTIRPNYSDFDAVFINLNDPLEAEHVARK